MKETKPHILTAGEFHLRNPATGRTERQEIGSVQALSINQARAFRDMFAPEDGVGFEDIKYKSGQVVTTPAPASVPVDSTQVTADPPADDPVEPEPVNANKTSADDMIAMIVGADAATVEMLAAAEEARTKGGRTTVIAAIDDRLDELEEGGG